MKTFSLIIFALINFASFSYLKTITKLVPFVIDKQKTSYNFKSKYLTLISLGNKNLMASTLWIITMIESDIDHYKQKDRNSWMFHRFNTITDLNKHFYQAYRVGGIYLSVIKDDIWGAKEIYEKGLKFFPDDIQLNYNFGFHAHTELKDYPLAIKLYEKVLADPKSLVRYQYSLPSIIAKLKVGNGDPKDAIRWLYEMKEKFKDNKILQERFNEKIRIIKNKQ